MIHQQEQTPEFCGACHVIHDFKVDTFAENGSFIGQHNNDHYSTPFEDEFGHGCLNCHISEPIQNTKNAIHTPGYLREHAEAIAAGTYEENMEVVHGRVPCTNCHPFHEDSEEAAQISVGHLAEAHELPDWECVDCHTAHSGVTEGPLAAKGVRDPESEPCSTCHDPHTVEEVVLSTQTWEEDCTECHALPIHEEQTGDHEPLRDEMEGCTSCHDREPHMEPPFEVRIKAVDLVPENLRQDCIDHHLLDDHEWLGPERPPSPKMVFPIENTPTPCETCHPSMKDILGDDRTHKLQPHDVYEMACKDCHEEHVEISETYYETKGTVAVENEECGTCHDSGRIALSDEAHHDDLVTACAECHEAEPHARVLLTPTHELLKDVIPECKWCHAGNAHTEYQGLLYERGLRWIAEDQRQDCGEHHVIGPEEVVEDDY